METETHTQKLYTSIERQYDGTWTVFTSFGTNRWGIGAYFPTEEAAQRVADVIAREAIGGVPNTQ